ncbi:hypothetical protein COO60DRAFT_812780 [Scenedesmus sp. NREL 46B-D3]|nr:hypothetical protein COO60DRAFT_812780 [Scenedesmus sp. NREL 46B-D3]
MAGVLQQVLMFLLVVACGYCQASRHNPGRAPCQQRTAVMHMAVQNLQYAVSQLLSAADACSTLRERKKCLHRSGACVWCQNKYSPWPGSDGVCTSPDQAKYLPDSTYKCSKITLQLQRAAAATRAQPAAVNRQAAAAKQPSGGGDDCGQLREKKKCLHRSGACVWCQNKYSPWPGSDGVCTSPDQAKYLPESTYKCSKIQTW